MNEVGEAILQCLGQVASERQRRAVNPALAAKVAEVKRFQHARFASTYADLLADQRYGGAGRFFLEDLYGPGDFSERDMQFVRVVPALLRLFPDELVRTVAELAALHALSERMDTAMGEAMAAPGLDACRYGTAWRHVGDPAGREQQVALMLSIGTALDKYTRNPLLRHSLRLMRGPAQAAGLGALQRFLETGFDTFRAMRGAEQFLSTIASRERELSWLLFGGSDVPEPPAGLRQE